MTPDWTLVDAALDQALDFDSKTRERYLSSLSPEMQTAVRPLLDSALGDDPLLDHSDAALAPLVDDMAAADSGGVETGTRLGPYCIEALVGEGGMGRVYRARRADGAYDRTVALKVVRRSLTLAGSDVAQRLRRERDLLAALDHPGIARLVDGGETDDGVPYLVTEFVDGVPITDYAEARGLSIEARIRLVVDVARAVDHAHRRLVVHRDLKPSNVLVAEADPTEAGGRGAPRAVVLDFGVAKLLDEADAATGDFPLTRTGLRMLTPAYAAPELFDHEATLTTAADIYGLGALLYELLTGLRPHGDGTKTGTLPTSPSQAVGGDERAATQRSRRLRGDLDTIALRALAPDPARRYDSAGALADDLERHLAGRPVEARPDSVAYVWSRYVRRHRGAVVAASVALIALVAGLAVSLVSLARERDARAEAETQTARAAETGDFVARLFEAANPFDAGRTDVSARDVLDAGRAAVGDLDPALRADVLGLLATSYSGLGAYETADTLLSEAVALGAPVAIRLAYGRNLAVLGRPGESVPILRAALSAATPAERVGGLQHLAASLSDTDDLDGSIRVLEQARREARALGDSAGLARVLNTYGITRQRQFRHEDAVPLFRESARLRRAIYGPRDPKVMTPLANLGMSLVEIGQAGEGVRVLREVLSSERERLGSDHPDVALSLVNLGFVEINRGQPAAAVALLEESLAIHRSTFSDGHSQIATTQELLALALADLGRCAEALPLARTAAAAFDALGDGARLDASRARATIGRCMVRDGRHAEGRRLIRSAIETLQSDPASTPDEINALRGYLAGR